MPPAYADSLSLRDARRNWTAENLPRYLAGELPGPLGERITKHLSSCAKCRSEAAREEAIARRAIDSLIAEEPDPELGYVVADDDDLGGIRAVGEFVEKPNVATARALIARGGVWNSFIFAANAQALVRAFEARCPDLVGEMRHIVTSMNADARDARLAQFYEQLPTLDFSRDILQRSPELLRVMTVPACGWSDLGTPRRVVETVNRFRSESHAAARAPAATFFDLAGIAEARI